MGGRWARSGGKRAKQHKEQGWEKKLTGGKTKIITIVRERRVTKLAEGLDEKERLRHCSNQI